MNNSRRQQIRTITRKLIAAYRTFSSSLQESLPELQDILSDEQHALDNLPESLQYSYHGTAMQDAIDNIEAACQSLEDFSHDEFDSILETLSAASE